MKTILLCLIGFVCLVASQSCNCPQNQTLQLATFNTLQIPLATARTERREAQIEFFMNRSADIDILCLQELWEPVDRQFFISNLSSIYPYHVSGQPINSTCTAPCSENDMSIILTCANSITCLQTTTGFDFLSCIQTQCQLSPNVSSTCSQCLSGLDSGLSAQSKLHTCGGLRNVTNDTDTSCQFLFDGETDNLLLSKYPIIANDTLYYSISPFTSWSVTYAKINTTSQGIVNVFCTHVVASQPFIDLSQENFNETAELLQFIANKTQNESNPAVFVMGDFNFGPETDNLTAEFPDSYWAIRNANFSDTQWLYANLTGTPLNCTYCSANPLATFGTHDRVIDHIFVYNNTKVCIKGVEIFGKELNVLTADNTTVTLSDHYGLRAWYCPSNTTIGQSGTNTTTGGTGVSTTGGTTTSGGSTTSYATTGTEPPVPGWATTGSSSASTISVTGILVASIVGLVLAI